MYPANYYALFPAFPRVSSVFVAMSFDSRFVPRWENVIKPAIQSPKESFGEWYKKNRK